MVIIMGKKYWVTLNVIVTLLLAAKAEVREVITRDGIVQGRPAVDGDYIAFLGIPYAEPPVGNLRYKKPQPPKPWLGVLPERTAKCVQKEGGEEDCLLLHVFTPTKTSSEPLPVLVFIHGGGFIMGQAATIGYDALVNKGLIVVAMNYRLGTLGWLCLGTEQAPGNAGLYDQVAALRWVRDNIGAFGGDPARVTLGGMSSGSISTHVLSLTEAEDLFQQVICFEGTAITPFSTMTTPLAYAQYYAKLLGYETNNVTDLEHFYMNVSAKEIGNKSEEFYILPNGEIGFALCVEKEIESVKSILTASPESLLAQFNKPVIFSFSNNEGSLYGAKYYKDLDSFNDHFERFVPSNLVFPADIEKEKVEEIKQFYFGIGNVTKKDTLAFSNYWADSIFLYPAVASVLAANPVPTYLLEFGYVGGLSAETGLPGVSGACHADMIHYMFPSKNATNEEDKRVVEELAKLVANFVRFGTPWVAYWPPVAVDSLCYLHLGNQTETRCNPYKERMSFWQQLYDNYRKTNYTWDEDITKPLV